MRTESQTLEFKRPWKDDYLRTICAFANGEGSRLLVGVDDDGQVMGLENGRELLETLPNKIHNKLALLVDVILNQQEGREYLEVAVQGTYAPVSYAGKFYKRSGSNTVELTGSNLTHFLLKKYGKTWDDIAEERFSLADIDPLTVEKFKRLAQDRIPGIQDEQSTKALLRKLNLYDGEHLKRAAILLFGRNPQQYYIQSHSKIGRFLSETDIQSSDIIEGNLIDQVDRLMDVLRLKYLKAYISYDGMHRHETLEYPYDALREAIINALIHRDYTDTSNLQIRVYDDRLVMYNGATLSPEVPIEKFDQPHQSRPFNPTMAAVFYKCGYIENWGRGTLNIIDYCLKAGLPRPEFAYEWGAVRATFYRKQRQDEHAVGGVSGGVKKLLEFIEENPGLTAKAISEAMDTPLRTIERWLKALREQEKIEFQGAPRTGGYVVKEH
ncbi:ATP-binding protein [Stutzerimonas nitrititolerans]|uniref:ATP-binding protein n=1 Tax=Stutzerimonas nitrititolerans TaxID=2482751 RepID=UPI0028ABA0FC|nr:ATP-binding protein [Stutzerimonas nitrititolerans]